MVVEPPTDDQDYENEQNKMKVSFVRFAFDEMNEQFIYPFELDEEKVNNQVEVFDEKRFVPESLSDAQQRFSEFQQLSQFFNSVMYPD